jgi:hypothetical protein
MSLSTRERHAVERIVDARIVATANVHQRHHIVRITLDDGRTAVVKRLRAEGHKRWDGDAGFHREWAALVHLAECDLVPHLLGGDLSTSVFVLAELPPGRSLADSLRSDDADQARTDLIAYATALAQVNSFAPFGAGPLPRLASMDTGRAAFDANGAVDQAFAALEAGPQGVVHGDPCPDNVVVDEAGTCHIFDFEFAVGGPVALDAAYLLAPFPSCWCFAPLPPSVAQNALAAYRSVLAIDDHVLDAAIVVTTVNGLAFLEEARSTDRSWGLTTMRPRLLTWLDACATQPSFPDAANRAAHLAKGLRAAWGDVVAPSYPAFADT